MTIKNWPDFVSGILFTVFGAVTVLLSRQYDMGTMSDMGPGYFPAMAGAVLVLIGLVVLIHGALSTDLVQIEKISIRHVILVLGPVLAFALLLPFTGMVIASLVLVIASTLASHEFHWRYAVVTAVVLTAACYGVFVYGLGLPLPTWPRGM